MSKSMSVAVGWDRWLVAVEVSDHDLRQGRETNAPICLGSLPDLRASLAVLASFHVSGAGRIVPSSLVDVEEPDPVWRNTYAGNIGRSSYVFESRLCARQSQALAAPSDSNVS